MIAGMTITKRASATSDLCAPQVSRRNINSEPASLGGTLLDAEAGSLLRRQCDPRVAVYQGQCANISPMRTGQAACIRCVERESLTPVMLPVPFDNIEDRCRTRGTHAVE